MADNLAQLRAEVGVDGVSTSVNELRKFGTGVTEVGGKFSGADVKSRGFFGGLLGMGAKLIPVIGAVGLVGGGLKSMIANASEGQNVVAQLEAVLKSTGGQAGVTKDQVLGLATSLSAASGKSKFGDELITQGENLLLTFTNIGSKTFPAATQAIVDMGQALGGTPSSNAILLGKALNDPVKGISALTRVGVTFSQGQKDVIAQMIATGDTAGAQKVILDELAKEFGGSAANAAKTFSGQMGSLKDMMGEVMQSAGDRLLPTIQKVVGFLADPATMGAIQAFANGLVDGIGKGVDFVSKGIDLVAPIIGGLGTYFKNVSKDGEPLADILESKLPRGLKGIALVGGEALNFVKNFAGVIHDSVTGGNFDAYYDWFVKLPRPLQGVVRGASDVAGGINQTVQALKDGMPLYQIMPSLLSGIAGGFLEIVGVNPGKIDVIKEHISSAVGVIEGDLVTLGSAGKTVAGIIGDTVTSLQNGEPAYQAIPTAVGDITASLLGLVGVDPSQITVYQQTVQDAVQGMFDTVSPILANISSTASTLWDGAVLTVQTEGPKIVSGAGQIWDQVSGYAQDRFTAVEGIVESVWGIISGFFVTNGADIVGTVQGWADTIGPIVSGGLAVMQSITMTVLGAIGQFFTDHGQEIQDTMTHAWDTIKIIVDAALTIIKDYILPALGAIAQFISDHGTQITGILDGAWTAISGVINGALTIISGWVTFWMDIIKGNWSGALDALNTVASGAWTAISGVFTGAFTIIKNQLDVFVPGFTGIWTDTWNGVSNTATTVWTLITKTINDAATGIGIFIGTKSAEISTGWTNFWNGVSSTATDIWNGISKALHDTWDTLTTWLTGAPKAIWGTLTGVGSGIVDGIKSGLNSSWGGLVSWLKTKIHDSLPQFIRDWLGITSPSKVMRDQVGIPMIQGITVGAAIAWPGLIQGIQTGLSDLSNAIQPQAKGALVPTAQDMVLSLSQGISGAWGDTVTKTVNDQLGNSLSIDPTQADQLGAAITQNIGTSLTAGWSAVDLAVNSQWDGTFGLNPTQADTLAGLVLTPLADAVTSGFAPVAAAVDAQWDPTWGLPTDRAVAVANLITAPIADAVPAAMDPIKAAVDSQWDPTWGLPPDRAAQIANLVTQPIADAIPTAVAPIAAAVDTTWDGTWGLPADRAAQLAALSSNAIADAIPSVTAPIAAAVDTTWDATWGLPADRAAQLAALSANAIANSIPDVTAPIAAAVDATWDGTWGLPADRAKQLAALSAGPIADAYQDPAVWAPIPASVDTQWDGTWGLPADRAKQLAALSAGPIADAMPDAMTGIATAVDGQWDGTWGLPADRAKEVGALVANAVGDGITSAWSGVENAILAMLDATWGLVEARAAEIADLADRVAKYGSATGGPGSGDNNYQGAGGQNKGHGGGTAKVYGIGGHIDAGQMGIVGDKGVELFIPDVSGTIVSHDKSLSAMSDMTVLGGGGGGSGNLTLNGVQLVVPQNVMDTLVAAARRTQSRGRGVDFNKRT